MNLFKKLFGIKEKETPTETMETQVPQIDKPTFIEERDPTELLQQIVPQPQNQKSLLEELLNKDYFAMGKRDGYSEHDLSVMGDYAEVIVADFRLAYSKGLMELETRIDKVRPQLNDEVKEHMPAEYKKLKSMLEQYEQQRNALTREKDLAMLGEGYIEKPIRCYRAGFKKGYSLWNEETLLIPNTKTI